MSAIYQDIVSFILVYRYLALFIVSFLSSLGVPLPAAASTAAAAAFASQGYLNIAYTVLAGAAGNILGDITMYFLIRTYGIRVLLWFRLRKLVESPMLKNVERTVDSYSAIVIIASRFQDQATTLVNIISGLGKMRFKRFLTYISIGDFAQIIFYVAIGVVFADNWQEVYSALGKFGWIVALLVIIGILYASTRAIRKVYHD